MPKDPSAGYNVRNLEVESLLRELAQDLKAKMPEGWGFALLISSFGEGGATFYISSVQREDMLKLMQEFIDRNRH